MELLYSIRRKPVKCEQPLISEANIPQPLCVISIGNVIAFSSCASLSDPVGDSCGGFVYVCDLDSPWDYHLVASLSYPVSCLEWNCEGKQLVVGTTTGDISVYGMKDFLLNQWVCLYTANFPCEPIVTCIAFHHGRRVVQVASDKKGEGLISDRIQALPLAPTMRGHGGVSSEGCLAITECGILIAMTPSGAAGGKPYTSRASLRPKRDRVSSAAMAHRKDGSVLVAAVCSHPSGLCRVVVSALTMTMAQQRPVIGVRALPTFILPYETLHRVRLSWTRTEESLWVLSSSLHLYRLQQASPKLHSVLLKLTQGNVVQPTDFVTLTWHMVGSWGLERAAGAAGLGAVCDARVGALMSHGPALALFGPGLPPCSLNILSPESSSTKKPKYGANVCLTDCCTSYLGGVVVAISHRADLHVCRLPQPQQDLPLSLPSPVGGSPPSLPTVLPSLELAALRGADCTDLLLSLTPKQAEAAHDRMMETFSRQGPHFQQYYYHAWLRIRIALLRVVGTASSWCSVSSLESLVSLHACWAAVCTAIRPDDRPDSAAMALLDDKITQQHDKTLLSLESKAELSLELCGGGGGGGGQAHALLALSRHLRHAHHTALTIVAGVAQSQAQTYTHSCSLWSDPSALVLVRKLLLVSRSMPNAVVDPSLPRLLARLPPSPPHHKHDLLEECSVVAASHGARVWECHPRTAVSAPHGQTPPYQLEVGVEPSLLRVTPSPPAYACTDRPDHIDSINYMYLGSEAARWRQCTRCGAHAHGMPLHAPRLPAQRAIMHRCLPTCRCGGKWTLVSNV